MEFYDNVLPPEEKKTGRPITSDPKYPFHLIGIGQVMCLAPDEVPKGGTTSIRSALNLYKRKNNVTAEFRIGAYPDYEGAIGVWRLS